MIIAFVGIDGAGKSTYAHALLGYNLNKDYIYIHPDSIFANKLISLSLKLRKMNENSWHNKKDKEICRNDDTRKNILFLVAHIIWMILLTLDSATWYLIKFRKLYFNSKKENYIIICDRYFYDNLISAIYSLPVSIRETMYRIYMKIFPIPDVMFFLDIDPQIAYLRKKEDALSFLRNKYQLYTEFLSNYKKLKGKNNKKIYTIRTDKMPIHINIKRIIKIIWRLENEE